VRSKATALSATSLRATSLSAFKGYCIKSYFIKGYSDIDLYCSAYSPFCSAYQFQILSVLIEFIAWYHYCALGSQFGSIGRQVVITH